MQTIKVIDTVVPYNGKDHSATIKIEYDYDEFPEIAQDFDFGNEKENEEYLNRFRDFDLYNILIYVSVRINTTGFEGSDSLGSCHVTSTSFLQDLLNYVEEHGMIETATMNLVEEIDSTLKLFA